MESCALRGLLRVVIDRAFVAWDRQRVLRERLRLRKVSGTTGMTLATDAGECWGSSGDYLGNTLDGVFGAAMFLKGSTEQGYSGHGSLN